MVQSIYRVGSAWLLRRDGLGTLVTAIGDRAKEFGVPFARGVLVGPSERGREGDTLFPVGTLIQRIDGNVIGTLDELYERIDRRVRRERSPRILMEGIVPGGQPLQVEVAF